VLAEQRADERGRTAGVIPHHGRAVVARATYRASAATRSTLSKVSVVVGPRTGQVAEEDVLSS